MLILLYIVFLAAGLGLPAVSAMQPTSMWWLALIVNIVSALVLLVATFSLCLVLSKLIFPEYWWKAQVEHEDIYEYDGVYFIGVRQSRQKSRIQKLIFGVDERMRKWDMVFGILFIVFTVPHFLGGNTLHTYYGTVFQPASQLPQTMHTTALSSLPVMKKLGISWNTGEEVNLKLRQALANSKAATGNTNAIWFEKAQLHLLAAFTPRTRNQEPYQLTPGEEVFFNRGQAAQSITYLERILSQPELKRGEYSRGALALNGLFHLSDMAYGKAQEAFDKALTAPGEGEKSGIARYQIVLLAAQAAMLNADITRAETLLESLLVDDRLPRNAYPLAVEHFAETMRLSGRADRAEEMLGKARKLYESQNNKQGLARIHLREAAIALERKQYDVASQNLSTAAGLAKSQRDGFTLNMVDWLSQEFKAVN